MASVSSPAVTKLSPPKKWVVREPPKYFECGRFPFSFLPLGYSNSHSHTFSSPCFTMDGSPQPMPPPHHWLPLFSFRSMTALDLPSLADIRWLTELAKEELCTPYPQKDRLDRQLESWGLSRGTVVEYIHDSAAAYKQLEDDLDMMSLENEALRTELERLREENKGLRHKNDKRSGKLQPPPSTAPLSKPNKCQEYQAHPIRPLMSVNLAYPY